MKDTSDNFMDKFKNVMKKLSDKFIIFLKGIKNIFVPEDITIEGGTIVTPPKPIAPYIIIVLILVIYFASDVTGFSLIVVLQRIGQPFQILKRMWPPDYGYWKEVIVPIFETIQISLLGSFLGAAFALPVAFIASSNIIKNKFSIVATRIILSIFRTVPVLIYASIFTKVLGWGALAGTLALTLFTFSIVAKMLYEKIETIDLGAFEALQSTGATKSKGFVTAILPQILPSYYSISLYSFEINIRYAAILGYVGAGGVGYLLDRTMQRMQYDKTVVILFFILIVVVAIESLSRHLRRRLN